MIEIFNKEECEQYKEDKERLLKELFDLLTKLHLKRTGEEMIYNLHSIETSGDKANFVSECKRMQLTSTCIPKLVSFLELVTF